MPRVIGGEESDGRRDIFRLADAAQGYALAKAGEELRPGGRVVGRLDES